MIQIAICDDDHIFLENVKERIQRYLQEKDMTEYSITEFDSALSCYKSMEAGMLFDVLFLDITMPEMSGLELAKEIRQRDDSMILIFMTAFLDYAIEGYRLQVLRYILKDMLEELLPECMDTVVNRLMLKQAAIGYSFVEGKITLNVKSIAYIESHKHKLLFHMADGRIYSLYDKLDNMQKQLQRFGFLRVHKSFMINIEYIEEISGYQVRLVSGEAFPIPRERFQEVKQQYYFLKGGLL